MADKDNKNTDQQNTQDNQSNQQPAQVQPAPLQGVNPANPVVPQPTPDIDKTIPGGRYLVDGKLVDANGQEIKDDKSKDNK